MVESASWVGKAQDALLCFSQAQVLVVGDSLLEARPKNKVFWH